MKEHRITPDSDESKPGLEARVFPKQAYNDPQPEFVFAPYVCQILVPYDGDTAVNGTGFLVGKDLVLTNFHVVENFDTTGIHCKFDVKAGKPGTEPDGPTVKVEKMLAHSTYSAAEKSGDYDDNPQTQAASDELDYALLKLERPFGQESFEIRRSNPVRRGWLCLPDRTPEELSQSEVYILQHPNGQPLVSHEGPLTAHQPAATRMRYRVNTEGGSSGSPCFQWSKQKHEGLVPVFLHNYGDPSSLGQKSEFNHGVPLHLVYLDLIAKGITGLDEKPQYKTIIQNVEQSFTNLPPPQFDQESLLYDKFVSQVDYPPSFPTELFQLSMGDRDYSTVDVDEYLQGDQLARTNQDFDEIENRYDAEVELMQSQLDDLESEKHDLERDLHRIKTASEPRRPDEPDQPSPDDPQYQLQLMAHQKWQEELQKYESELIDHREKRQSMPALESSINNVEQHVREMQANIESKKTDFVNVKSDWEDRFAEARDHDILETLYALLDATENTLGSARSYCQGFMTLLASQPICRLLLTKVQDASLILQIRKLIEQHTNEMTELVQKRRKDFISDLLYPVAFVKHSVAVNGATLEALETTLNIDNRNDYYAVSSRLQELLSQTEYQRTDYQDMENAEDIRAKHNELLEAKFAIEQYDQSVEQAKKDIPEDKLAVAQQVFTKSLELTGNLDASWQKLDQPLQRIFTMWAGLKRNADTRSSTPEFAQFSNELLAYSDSMFGKPVLGLLNEAIVDQAGLKIGTRWVAENPASNTIGYLEKLDARRLEEKQLLQTINDDIEGIKGQTNRVATERLASIKRNALLSLIPGFGSWFHYKLITGAKKAKTLKLGNDPVYDQLFGRAKLILATASVGLGVAFGSLFWFCLSKFTSSGSTTDGLFTNPLLSYPLLLLSGLSSLLAVVGVFYWIFLMARSR